MFRVREGVVSKLDTKEKVHFIGIGGIGMSGIAHLLLRQGYAVSGSDLQVSKNTRHLADMGAIIYQGHHRDNLAENVQTVVVSSAIPLDNPEIVEAKKRDLPILARAEMLAQLMKGKKGIAIAGAHGKTTTTAMLAALFTRGNYDPTIVAGGNFPDLNGNARLGQGEFFIAEADESDCSFLALEPLITVVTNIEDEHLDFYRSSEKIKEAFQQFVLKTPPAGFAVLCLDDPGVGQLIPQLAGKVKLVTYGFSPQADYQARNLATVGLTTRFRVIKEGEDLGEVTLNLPGQYNVLNALAAIATGMGCGLPFADLVAGLKVFRGVQRRFEKIAEIDGIHIFDDYAHHPSELKATLAAAQKVGAQRVIAIFQPHRFSRTRYLREEFGTAFQDADLLIMTAIYSAGEKPLPGVDTPLLLAEIAKQTGQQGQYIPDKSLIAEYLLPLLRPGDLVLTLGAGDIWLVGVALRELLRGKQ